MNKIMKLEQTLITKYNGQFVETSYLLILLGEVRKSGAKIYFRPANNDFTCNQKDYFATYAEAYESENW